MKNEDKCIILVHVCVCIGGCACNKVLCKRVSMMCVFHCPCFIVECLSALKLASEEPRFTEMYVGTPCAQL